MDNQHKLISGYRSLTQAEIDLINEIKAKGDELMQLCYKVKLHIDGQVKDNKLEPGTEDTYRAELQRLENAEPYRWYDRARESYQYASMFMVRAIAQPTTFC